VRRGRKPFERQSVGVGAERVAIGSEPKHHVEPSFIARAAREHRGQFVDGPTGDGRVRIGGFLGQGHRDDLLVDQTGIAVGSDAVEDQRDAGQDLRLVWTPIGQW
jgi:hypothetical protein